MNYFLQNQGAKTAVLSKQNEDFSNAEFAENKHFEQNKIKSNNFLLLSHKIMIRILCYLLRIS